MNRGSGSLTPDPEALLTRFNEAPIHESGKYQYRRERAEHHPASMRPRFMNRGSQR